MKLQTQIPIEREKYNPIDYNSSVLLFGSCFVENIGEKLEYYKFQNFQNPFGILFHPLAIESLITNAINDKEYTEVDIFCQNEQWHNFEAHSKLSHTSKEDLLVALNTQIRLTHQQIKLASHIVITLGTAWVYRNIALDAIVANCHKVPQKQFLKEILSVDAVSESLEAIISLIRHVNPKTAIIFTISPVRHIKDGFVENTQSKAHLIAAVHSVVSNQAQSRSLHYFHSYEIMMDELRDYRFYTEDMLHPNKTAIQYIWEKFQQAWINPETESLMHEVETIQKGLLHKPFNQNSEAHQSFLKKLEASKKRIQKTYSHIAF